MRDMFFFYKGLGAWVGEERCGDVVCCIGREVGRWGGGGSWASGFIVLEAFYGEGF